MLTFKFTGNDFEIRHASTYLGSLVIDDAGVWYYLPPSYHFSGFWSSWMLREIADKLEEINKPILDELEKAFKNFDPGDDDNLDF